MKHLLSILILLGYMSMASAGWFFTSDEEYIENCADDTILSILKGKAKRKTRKIYTNQHTMKNRKNRTRRSGRTNVHWGQPHWQNHRTKPKPSSRVLQSISWFEGWQATRHRASDMTSDMTFEGLQRRMIRCK